VFVFQFKIIVSKISLYLEVSIFIPGSIILVVKQ